MGAAAYYRHFYNASEIREQQYEADLMGIKIAAMACFDTKKGSEVFMKMHQSHSDAMVGTLKPYLLKPTLSDERFEHLYDARTHEDALKYMDSSCFFKANKTWYECMRNIYRVDSPKW